MSEVLSFPEGFLWGTATASYQIPKTSAKWYGAVAARNDVVRGEQA